MKFTGNLVLIILVSIVVSSAIVFAVQMFDLTNPSKDDEIALLQNKINNLENLIKTMNQSKPKINDDDVKDYVENTESNLKLESKDFEIDELEARIKSLEGQRNNGSKNDIEGFEEALKSEVFKEAVKEQIQKYFEDAKEKQQSKKRSQEFNKTFGKFKEDFLKLAKKLGLSDEEIEKTLTVAADYIENLLALKAEYGADNMANLSEEQKQEYYARMKELGRDEFYAKIRTSVGDETFMKLRTESRRRDDLKNFDAKAKQLQLEQWQIDKVNEAMNRHYEQTKYLDMIVMTEKHSDTNVKNYQQQIKESLKLVSDEIVNSILTDEQRRKVANK